MCMLRLVARVGLALLVALASYDADARATIRIINLDAMATPPTGLLDPTPVDPVGGNPGTTLGEQRANVLRYVADIWSEVLDSSVEIRIGVTFGVLSCSAAGVTLAGTSRRSVVFLASPPPGARLNYFYPSALASHLRNQDVIPQDQNHITISVNRVYGTLSCFPSAGFYLGFDKNIGTGQSDLVTILLHEIAHGLGFSTTTNASSGAQAQTTMGDSYPSIYDLFVYDKIMRMSWDQMNQTQRANSATNFNQVIWDGPMVNAMTQANGSGIISVKVNSPATIAQRMRMTRALFGPVLSPATAVTGQVAIVSPANACPAITNPGAIRGKLALINASSGGSADCTFLRKTQLAQQAGAIGVVMRSADFGLVGMAGTDPTIIIPTVMITQRDAVAISTPVLAGMPVTMTLDAKPDTIDTNKRMYLFTPTTVVPGSSISHWDSVYTPTVLMDPSIDNSLPHSLDLTVRLLADIGWFHNGRANRKIAFYQDGDTPGLYTLENRSTVGPESLLGSNYLTPSWAPHGQRLAVAKVKDTGAVVIALINADGSGEREITSSSGFDFFPMWSPDGNKIAFVRDETGSGISSSLYVIDVEGTNLRRLTRVANVYDLRPTWSPDSTQLMFSRLRPDATRAAIYRINVNGTDEQRITNGTFKDLDPDWAPDGSKVVFASDRFQGRSQIFTMNPDGTGIARLTLTASEEMEPRWSPDSQKIVFVSQRKGGPQIFAMDREGFKPERLTVGEGAEMTPAWQGLP